LLTYELLWSSILQTKTIVLQLDPKIKGPKESSQNLNVTFFQAKDVVSSLKKSVLNDWTGSKIVNMTNQLDYFESNVISQPTESICLVKPNKTLVFISKIAQLNHMFQFIESVEHEQNFILRIAEMIGEGLEKS
jgi:hypothetical protein